MDKVNERIENGLIALSNKDLGGAHYEFYNACVKIRQRNHRRGD